MIEEDINKNVNDLFYSLEIPKKISYNYPGLEYLNDEFPTLLNENDIIHICAYNVNVLNKYPFLQYFLYKPHNETSFFFPSFLYKNEMDLLTKSMSVINAMCLSYYKDTFFNYKGYIKEDNCVYLFFDCSHMKIDTLKMTEYNDLWLVIIDEIINYKSVCGSPIDEIVVELFYTYEKFTYLTDDDDDHYQMPIIGYSTCDFKKIDFVATFGIQLKNDFLGNYYYFNVYEDVVNNITKCGIIRCVIFTDNMKIIYDDIDSNEITEWNDSLSLLFDSVYYTNPSLKNNIWAVKNDNQYLVLSVHINNNNK
jgi:L-rhamnose mutarotase